jgi:DNA-binding NarL/FixJ family response regulator
MAGLVSLVVEKTGCNVVALLPGAPEAADLLVTTPADIVLWDLGWEASFDLEDDAEALDRILTTGTPCIALVDDPMTAMAVRMGGVTGVLSRDVDAGLLADAMKAVMTGLIVIGPSLSEIFWPERDWPAGSPIEPLTPRETQVLQLLADGLSNRAIGQRLAISEHTAKFHVTAIMSKLAAQSRTEAVVRATRLGLIYL